ncbi:hypothetical protein KJY78_00150 [Canibacter sp. lx-45]|uniref:hypothetical protein n=1 Tax=Canibacter zhuwentaonis TaxID=2837491 RepID=UPI001BDBBC26|nr:hypothetical protein [Canibacter zhuwentaonis]MBT1034771.1 hypothetical protein [Canibacter zhuwentaonis]
MSELQAQYAAGARHRSRFCKVAPAITPHSTISLRAVTTMVSDLTISIENGRRVKKVSGR